MSEVETSPGLSEAYHSAKEAHNLAISTGVPRRDTFDEHGIKQEWKDSTERSVMTEGASITQSVEGRVEIDKKLPTGEYRTGFYRGQPFVNVVVERKGYEGTISGHRRERAVEIIAKKVADEIGRTAATRSIKMGQEYIDRLSK